MNKKFISWRRVSTFRQSKSGLGLEAQKAIIRYFIERDKGEWVADYEECYTGKELSGCVQLHKAMEHAKRTGATLIIAKSDRFRNTAEALKIYEEMGDGNIMFCDLPATDKFTLTLFFALAEREALIVSIRTKQALAVKKSQGAKLGASNDAYQRTRAARDIEDIKRENAQRGATKRERHLASRDVQALLKIMRNVYAEACSADDPKNWDWKNIKTSDGIRQKVLMLMRDYREIDTRLFAKWNFDDINGRALQVKLASTFNNLKKSILK